MNLEHDIARYENYLRLDPGNPRLLILLGEAYMRQGRLDDALQSFDKVLSQTPNDITAHARRAELLLAQQRHAEAEQALRELLRVAPETPALWHNLGLALHGQHRWEAAAHAFRQARDGGLALPRNTLYLGYCLHRLGRLDDALGLCREDLAMTQDAALDGYLCLLELDAGRMSAAHSHALSVLERHPDNADAALVCSLWHLERQETEQAEPHIDNALRSRPLAARAWLARGLMHLYRQQHDQAISALETAAAGMPDHLGTRVTLGWARFAARDAVGAERVFRDVIALDGGFAEGHGGLAAALAAQGRRDEARRCARVARRLEPGNLAALWVSTALNSPGSGHSASFLERALRQPLDDSGRSLSDHIRIYARWQMQGAARPDDAGASH